MKITHLRNATVIVELGPYRILVDPMLAPRGSLPALKLGGGRERNPTVGLPPGWSALLDTVTHCLITHCQKGHFDHLDRAGKRWLRERGIPVICTPHDAGYLRKRGLDMQPLASSEPASRATLLSAQQQLEAEPECAADGAGTFFAVEVRLMGAFEGPEIVVIPAP
jgi:hypothetical protein